MGQILEGLGFFRWGRPGGMVMQEGGNRPVLYCRKGMEKSEFSDYLAAQGYTPP
jgi:hypothetical protein